MSNYTVLGVEISAEQAEKFTLTEYSADFGVALCKNNKYIAGKITDDGECYSGFFVDLLSPNQLSQVASQIADKLHIPVQVNHLKYYFSEDVDGVVLGSWFDTFFCTPPMDYGKFRTGEVVESESESESDNEYTRGFRLWSSKYRSEHLPRDTKLQVIANYMGGGMSTEHYMGIGLPPNQELHDGILPFTAEQLELAKQELKRALLGQERVNMLVMTGCPAY